jgi:CRP-like cAMP-binding protein
MIENFKKFLISITPVADDELEEILFSFKPKILKKNTFFIQQGKICRQVAYINKGTLRGFYINDKGEEITSCFCIENNFTTSYTSLIQQQPSKISIQTLEDTELLVMDYEALQKLFTTNSAWQRIGRLVAENRFIIMEEYSCLLSGTTAKDKYLQLLREKPVILQKASLEAISSYLGITRRTLSRIRNDISSKEF